MARHEYAATSCTPIEALLSRLEGLRQKGHSKWLARCPAHEDRSPSLSIRETDDGLVLVHCFASCAVDDIVAAVGLTTADLFPPKLNGHSIDPTAPKTRMPRFSARELLELASIEARIVAIAACSLARGVALSTDDLLRVGQAAQILSGLVQEVSRHA